MQATAGWRIADRRVLDQDQLAQRRSRGKYRQISGDIMWLKIAAGGYYLIGSALLLKKFVTTRNAARGSARIEKDDLQGAVGFVGAKAGIILKQDVPGTTWATKIPIEYHFTRKSIPQPFIDDWENYEAYVEQNLPEFAQSDWFAPLKMQLGEKLPTSVEFYIQTEWWDNSFNPERFSSTANHRFYLDNEFQENTMAEYEVLNNPDATSTRTVQPDINGLKEVASSAVGGPPNTAGPGMQWQQDKHEPLTYGVIEPYNMTGGIPILSFLDDVQLSFKSKMVPRIETTSWADLLMFFAWTDPNAFNHSINARDQVQQIDYALW